MERQLAALVEEPCKETYLAARAAVLRESPWPLTAVEILELDRLLESAEHQLLLDRLSTLPPSKVLSPRIHFLAAEASEALGDMPEVELERSLFVLTLQGLLSTGDGTAANPYVVCHPCDEYDVLAALGLEAAGQSLVERESRFYDVLLSTGGQEIWFDVTEILVPRRAKIRAARRRRIANRRRNRTVSRLR
jgi:hypothetical protein